VSLGPALIAAIRAGLVAGTRYFGSNKGDFDRLLSFVTHSEVIFVCCSLSA
jgi:hypothetical protein